MAEESLTISKLKERFPDSMLEVAHFRGETTVYVRKGDIVKVCRFLRDDPELQYNFLSDLCGVDRLGLEPRFEVVYNLYSIPYAQRIRLKVKVSEGEEVDTVTGVWGTANWHEREVYDLFGIRFLGHPDLCRILMPEDWEGHPLRKDYPVQEMPKWWEVGKP